MLPLTRLDFDRDTMTPVHHGSTWREAWLRPHHSTPIHHRNHLQNQTLLFLCHLHSHRASLMKRTVAHLHFYQKSCNRLHSHKNLDVSLDGVFLTNSTKTKYVGTFHRVLPGNSSGPVALIKENNKKNVKNYVHKIKMLKKTVPFRPSARQTSDIMGPSNKFAASIHMMSSHRDILLLTSSRTGSSTIGFGARMNWRSLTAWTKRLKPVVWLSVWRLHMASLTGLTWSREKKTEIKHGMKRRHSKTIKVKNEKYKAPAGYRPRLTQQ